MAFERARERLGLVTGPYMLAQPGPPPRLERRFRPLARILDSHLETSVAKLLEKEPGLLRRLPCAEGVPLSIIGDDGRVYVGAGVPEFLRDCAVPAAKIVSPNAFELAWLTGRVVASRVDAVAALVALRGRGPEVAFATSLRLDDTPDDALDLIVAAPAGVWRVRTPKLPIAVNGAGDLISALFLHEWLHAHDAAGALAMAAARVYAVVAATVAAGGRELALVAAQDALADPPQRFAPEKL